MKHDLHESGPLQVLHGA